MKKGVTSVASTGTSTDGAATTGSATTATTGSGGPPVNGETVTNGGLTNNQQAQLSTSPQAAIRSLPVYQGYVANGMNPELAESIVRATPPSIGPPGDEIFSINGEDIGVNDPGWAAANTQLNADADAFFSSPGQMNPVKMNEFMNKAGPVVGVAIMALKIAGLDDLGEQNMVGGMMRDAMMQFGGPAGMMIAGAMTAVPYLGVAAEHTIGPVLNTLGDIFGGLNLGGGTTAAGTTVDTTIIDMTNFDPLVMDEILTAVDGDPDFLGLGYPVTREQILNGKVGIPDSFLADIASGHGLSLDDARGDAVTLGRGEGGIDVSHTRHNLSTGGGTASSAGLAEARTMFGTIGIARPGLIDAMLATASNDDIRAIRANPTEWMRANGWLSGAKLDGILT